VTFADYSASDYDIRITQGDTFTEEMLFEDGEGEAIDLTGYSFKSQLRRTADNGLVADFNIVIEDNEFIRRTLAPAVTSGLSGTYVHDLQWTNPQGQIKTLLTGEFEIEPEVTR
jgi:hypothetical protein